MKKYRLLNTMFMVLIFTITAYADHGQNYSIDSIVTNSSKENPVWNGEIEQGVNSADSIEEAIEATQADSLFEDITCFDTTNRDPLTMQDTVSIPMAYYDKLGNSAWRFPGGSRVTSPFGKRKMGWHYGTDLRIPVDDSVHSVFGGVVRFTRNGRRGYGKVVIVRHNNGLETLYGHLNKILVVTGQQVVAGEGIGLAGNTGRSTGPHLHLEIRFCGQALNPEMVFNFAAQSLESDTLLIDRSAFAYQIELRKAKYCRIKRGDTLLGIARRYGASVKRICQLNEITVRTTLRLGWKIRYQ
jgi:murein DD-endopeptidase MepM/ murein hydrolase activator NlpD